MKYQLLLIEDDKELANLVCRFLANHGFSVRTVASVAQFQQFRCEHSPDLVICDIMLPDGNGFDLYPQIKRRFNSPILFLTALDSDRSQIKGLNLGANDYLIKPIRPEVLLARINTLLRNLGRPSAHKQVGPLRLDDASRTLHCNDNKVALNDGEFQLLSYLVAHHPTPAPRETLFKEVIGREYDGLDRAIDLKVSRLRKKFRTHNMEMLDIRSVRGQGYSLVVDKG